MGLAPKADVFAGQALAVKELIFRIEAVLHVHGFYAQLAGPAHVVLLGAAGAIGHQHQVRLYLLHQAVENFEVGQLLLVPLQHPLEKAAGHGHALVGYGTLKKLLPGLVVLGLVLGLPLLQLPHVLGAQETVPQQGPDPPGGQQIVEPGPLVVGGEKAGLDFPAAHRFQIHRRQADGRGVGLRDDDDPWLSHAETSWR